MGHHLVCIHMENHHGNEVLQLNEMDHVFLLLCKKQYWRVCHTYSEVAPKWNVCWLRKIHRVVLVYSIYPTLPLYTYVYSRNYRLGTFSLAIQMTKQWNTLVGAKTRHLLK